jgi:hypothetical protein
MLLSAARAQVVTEEVNFDYYLNVSDNDFANHFSGGYGMEQIQSDGITGGCLTVPDSISWGNDNAVYCSRYKPLTGDTTVTSLAFKYDSATVHLSSYQRAMSIWMTPYSDFNHYIVATVSPDKKIEILTYGWNNNPYPLLALHSNHWYNYQLTTIFGANQQVTVKAVVYDLGTTGFGNPVLVNSSSGSFIDNVLSEDTSIQVSITGASYGGTKYLDNFSFHGPEGVSNCINVATGTSEPVDQGTINVFPNPAGKELIISTDQFSGSRMAIVNLQGQKMMEFYMDEPTKILDVENLAPGIYFLQCQQGIFNCVSKVIIAR